MGRLPPDAPPLPRIKPGLEGGLDGFSSQTVYLRNEGVLQIPLSEAEDGSGGDCLLIKTSSSWGKKIVFMTAIQTGRVPDMQSAVPANTANEILESAVYGISEPRITPGGFQFAVSAKFEYILLRAPTETDGFESVKNPATDDSAFIGGSKFKSG